MLAGGWRAKWRYSIPLTFCDMRFSIAPPLAGWGFWGSLVETSWAKLVLEQRAEEGSEAQKFVYQNGPTQFFFF